MVVTLLSPTVSLYLKPFKSSMPHFVSLESLRIKRAVGFLTQSRLEEIMPEKDENAPTKQSKLTKY